MQIESLAIYPVKSCQGIIQDLFAFTSEGFLFDRQWMFVDESNNFISQRQMPSLATIQTKLTSDHLELIAKSGDRIQISLTPSNSQKNVTVWNQTVSAVAELNASKWIEKNIGTGITLVRKNGERMKDNPTKRFISFADSYPFLLCNLASLEKLNEKMNPIIPMNRFRANIIVKSNSAYEEDYWNTIQIGGTKLIRGKACTRCIITTTDQNTGKRNGQEPLLTLGKTRKIEKGVAFGQYFQPLESQGKISVGDQITIHDLQK
ncbi:MAG: MOSC domain-containing protein [Oligoflexia bacterium]|nr:MOSC domain-containing protein [Oligoflexia bacterium]